MRWANWGCRAFWKLCGSGSEQANCTHDGPSGFRWRFGARFRPLSRFIAIRKTHLRSAGCFLAEDHGLASWLACVELQRTDRRGWLRTAGTTCAGDEGAQRKVGWIVLKLPLSVSTMAFRHSVSPNATRQQADTIRNSISSVAGPNCGLSFERGSGQC